MYRVRLIGDPVLRKKADKITEFDKHLEKLVQDMIEVMHTEDGIGLAAPQIGISKRLLVIDASPLIDDEAPRAFINPVITETSGESVVEEGCLSIPGVREDVTRPEKITIQYADEKGREFTDTFDGWIARIVQHELDHLDGILFVDHISPVKRRFLINQNAIPQIY